MKIIVIAPSRFTHDSADFLHFLALWLLYGGAAFLLVVVVALYVARSRRKRARP